MAKGKRGYRPHQLSQVSVDIVLWAIAQHHPVTRAAIETRWGVHKSTSWRWQPVLEDARQRAHNMQLPTPTSYRRPIAMPLDQGAQA